MEKIKFLDLQELNRGLRSELLLAIEGVVDSGWYVRGTELVSFERSFADWVGAKFCAGVGNGLDAITIILRGYIELGMLKEGQEVVVPANTYIASILAILHAKLKPVLVEPALSTYNIDPNLIEPHISKNTKAILAVHLYGRPCEMTEINNLAKSHNLLVIEDAAQGHGGQYKNRSIGNLGDAAAFSFYPGKNLGALGDAGAITTNDADLNAVVKAVANYGSAEKYVNDYIGYNSRLDELQAAVLSVKIKAIEAELRERRRIAAIYLSEIRNDKIILPDVNHVLSHHALHLFVVRVQNNRDEFIKYLDAHGIETVIHYPVAPHKQKALRDYSQLSLPITELIHDTIVSIPLNSALSDADISRIVSAINNY